MNPILVLTYWSYNDALLQTALPHIKILSKVTNRRVYLICIEQKHINTRKDDRKAINQKLLKNNIHVVFFKYYKFGLWAIFAWLYNLLFLAILIIRKNIAFIHCWCTPAGAIGYLLCVVTRKKLIIDSYEPHAESMVENGTWSRDSVAFRLLFWLEKKQSHKAEHLIGVASGMRQYARDKYSINSNLKHVYVKPLCIDFTKFSQITKVPHLIEKYNLEDKIVCVYAGKLGGIYLDSEVFKFITECYKFWKEKFRFLLLSNADNLLVKSLAQNENLPEAILIHKFVPYEEIQNYLALGDFALNPVKPVPSKRYCTSIKDGEYWAMGLPVVITANISDDSDIIEDQKIGYVLKGLCVSEYKRAVITINTILNSDKAKRQSRIRDIGKRYRSLKIVENVYQKVYENYRVY